MSLFQISVLKSYLKQQDTTTIDKAFETFKNHFHSPAMQAEIRGMKEEQYQSGFLSDLFVKVFGYTLQPAENYNLVAELKNVSDAKKADGAVLDTAGKVIAVIELKGTDTPNLQKVQAQAFGYKNAHATCKYVITSNFEKLRFYINDTEKYLEFNLFALNREQFDLLYLCLAKENIYNDLPQKIKTETVTNEETITKKLYKDYHNFRTEIFNNIVELNPQFDKMLLFKKTQKLLDRFLFVFFAEDRQLLPANSIAKIVKSWNNLKDLDFEKPLYEIFKQYFGYINTGRKKTEKKAEIYPYNGGLFQVDEILDSIQINDELLHKHTTNFSSYDFESEISVNILGHIFEHSLNDLEEMQAQIDSGSRGGTAIDTKQSKRKKDGVFYTPQYITQYIVENTVGKLCEEQKTALDFEESEYRKDRKGRKKDKLKQLLNTLGTYRTWLTQITICDPACGSGAFLNEALQFLKAEHHYLDELQTSLLGGGFEFPNIEATILENNLYGVDINNESVEIAKLSLWLSTAKPNRKLSSLNNNIKCGNSLIDDAAIAGEKAFNWQTEFPQVFQEKDKQAFHVVLTTHNSRTSQRMIDNKVKKGEPVELNLEQEIALTKIIGDIITESGYHCLAYNVCKDHVHLILVCEAEELTKQVQKIKSISSKLIKRNTGEHVPLTDVPLSEHVPLGTTEHKKKGKTYIPFWSRKFFHANLDVWQLSSSTAEHIPLSVPKRSTGEHVPLSGEVGDSTYLNNATNYIRTNRQKHDLPQSDELEKEIEKFVTTEEKAFETEYKGGFDVVIGNPPYVDIKALDKDLVRALFEIYETTENRINLYSIFIEKGYHLVKDKGILSFINPNSILVNSSYTKIRQLLIDDISTIIKLPDDVFPDAKVETIIFEFRKNYKSEFANTLVYSKNDKIRYINTNLIKNQNKKFWKQSIQNNYNIYVSDADVQVLNRCKNETLELEEISDFCLGITPYDKYRGHSTEVIKNRQFHSKEKINDTYKPLISGGNINRFMITNEVSEYIKYGEWLGAMRDERFFIEPRIIVRQIVSGKPPRIFAGYSEKSQYFTQIGFAIIPNKEFNVKYLLTLINSKLLTYYHKYKFLDLEKDLFQKILIANCKKLPIKKVEFEQQQPFIEKAETMLSLNADLNQKKNRFLKRIQDNYEIEILSKKLLAFYDYDFKTFVAELKKKKVILSLVQQDEIEDYFTDYKTAINQLQNQISTTDAEIDKMVYQLYGLTNEEIQIVEGAV